VFWEIWKLSTYLKYILIISLLLSGCMTTRTAIIDKHDPDRIVVTVEALKEDKVTLTQGEYGPEIEVDGKKGPGMVEKVMALFFMNPPDVTVGAD